MAGAGELEVYVHSLRHLTSRPLVGETLFPVLLHRDLLPAPASHRSLLGASVVAEDGGRAHHVPVAGKTVLGGEDRGDLA